MERKCVDASRKKFPNIGDMIGFILKNYSGNIIVKSKLLPV